MDWSCVGWRNDKASFVCEVSGTKRGQVRFRFHVCGGALIFWGLSFQNPAFEHESELVAWSFAGVSDALLQRLGALATQYSRGIKAGAVSPLPSVSAEIAPIPPFISQGLSEFGESLVDLESPYCIEVGAEPLLALAAGLEKVCLVCSRHHSCNAVRWVRLQNSPKALHEIMGIGLI